MDEMACNYNVFATIDDGSCVYPEEFYGCDGNCLNDADGDGVCDELEVVGCQDESACNYNEEATDEGDCEYAEEFFDCDGNCLNDADGDGVCDELEVVGCQDEAACNYDDEATEDNDSCEFPGDPCDDGDEATINDALNESCECEEKWRMASKRRRLLSTCFRAQYETCSAFASMALFGRATWS